MKELINFECSIKGEQLTLDKIVFSDEEMCKRFCMMVLNLMDAEGYLSCVDDDGMTCYHYVQDDEDYVQFQNWIIEPDIDSRWEEELDTKKIDEDGTY